MESNINYDLFNEDYSTTVNNDYSENNKPISSRISMINDEQSTEHFLKEFDSFYTEMMSKVHGIRDTPVLNNPVFPNDIEVDEEKLYSNVKYTPDVLEQLEYIKKLDNEINSVINEYKIEKEERLETQYEMYNEITKNVVVERDADLFLNLCRFEFTDINKDKVEKLPDYTESKKEVRNPEDKKNSFIIRNIYKAKEGFNNSSLTDEEKCNLEKLIHVDNECEMYNNPFNTLSNREEDIKKLEKIDNELEKIQLDEQKQEKNKKNDQCKSVMEELDRLNDFMLKQRLKRIEAKLKTLREIEEVKKIEVQQIDDDDNEDVDSTEQDEDKYIKLTVSECDLDVDVKTYKKEENILEIAPTTESM